MIKAEIRSTADYKTSRWVLKTVIGISFHGVKNVVLSLDEAHELKGVLLNAIEEAKLAEQRFSPLHDTY